MLGYLLRKEAAVRAIAAAAEGRRINVDGALRRIEIQKSQVAYANNGNPITGEGITKETPLA